MYVATTSKTTPSSAAIWQVRSWFAAPPHPLGTDAWCSSGDASSNEICHGEIPTFLIEHTAPPRPLFLLGANGLLLSGSGPACGQPAARP